MIRIRLSPVLCLGVVLFLLMAPTAQADAPACDAPKDDWPNTEYRELVCAAARFEQEGRYAEAADAFAAAMDVPLHEFPNFELYPELARAYYKAGEEEAAKEALEKGRLALSVWTGVVVCEQQDEGPDYLLRRRWGNAVVTSPFADEIMDRMCGEMFEGYYANYNSFDEFRADAAMIKDFEQAESVLSGEAGGE